MKKKNWPWGLVAVCVVFLGVVLVKNLNYEAYDLDYTELSREELLRKMPEVVVNETDLAIGEALLELPEVQALAESEEPVSFSTALAAETIGNLLSQDTEIMDLSGDRNVLLLTYRQGKVQTTLQFSLDGSKEPYKGTKVSEKVYYEDLPDGTFRKNILRRDWLYFLKG